MEQGRSAFRLFLMQTFFVDAGSTLALPSNGPFTSPQGHLRVDANVTRAGVLKYVWPTADGGYEQVNVLRHPDEVFHPKSLASLSGLPLTLDHPVVDGKPVLVTPANVKKYGHGVVGDRIKVRNPYVMIEGLNYQTQDALEVLQKGNRQLSPGYLAKPVPESGIFDGIPFTHRQYPLSVAELAAIGLQVDGYTDDDPYILYNHMATMKPGNFGRSGDFVKVFGLDSATCVQMDQEDEPPEPTKQVFDLKPNGGKARVTRTITLHGDSNTHYAVDDAGMVMVPVDRLQAIMDSLTQLMTVQGQANTAMQTTGMDSLDKLAEAFNTLKGEKAIADSELAKRIDPTQLQTLVARRVELETIARPVLGDSFAADASDVDLMKSVVGKYDPALKTDGIDEAELRGMFRAVSKLLTQTDSSTKAATQAIADADDKNPPVTTDAKAKMKGIQDKLSKRSKFAQMVATKGM